MWVLKIGGSWISNPNLPKLLNLLQRHKNQEIIIVTGGGCFADSVRDVYHKINMTEVTGNFLALKSTEIFAHLLKSIKNEFFLTYNPEKFKKDTVNVWLPSKILSKNNNYKKSWDSTSDSISAWLNRKICSEGLIIIKSLPLKEQKYKLSELQKKEIIDKNFNQYVDKTDNIRISGPEVLNHLNENSDWEKFVLKLSKVIV